jgi:very-short-patch-repair endonuclease
MGKYVVDFVCFEKKGIIEVDGGQLLISFVNNQEGVYHD